MSFMHNPAFEKERWTLVRGHAFLIVLLAANALLTLVALAAMIAVESSFGGAGRGDYSVMQQIYLTAAVTEMVMVCLAMPVYAGSVIALERERGSLESFCAAGVTPAGIVWGKVCAAANVLAVLIISTLPVFSLTFVYGGIGPAQLVQMIGAIGLCGVFTSAVSLLCSSLCRHSAAAVLFSYAANILVYAVTFALHFLPDMLRGAVYGDRIGSAVAPNHYALLLNPLMLFYGVIDTQAGSGTAVFDFINRFGNYRANAVTAGWNAASATALAAASLLLVLLAVPCTRRRLRQ